MFVNVPFKYLPSYKLTLIPEFEYYSRYEKSVYRKGWSLRKKMIIKAILL